MSVKPVTIVIYEHPAALDEINAWGAKMHGKIKSIHRLKNNRIRFEMHSGEVLMCYPNHDFGFEEVTAQFTANHNCIFNKLLLFGKFGIDQIEKVQRVLFSCLELKKEFV